MKKLAILLGLALGSCSLLVDGVGPDQCSPNSASRCDGNTLVTCDQGFEIRTTCGDSLCSAEGAGSCGRCGDGGVDPGEACDDGPNNSDTSTTPGSCRTSCTRENSPAATGDS